MKAVNMRFAKIVAGSVVSLGLLSAGIAASKVQGMKEVKSPPFSGGVGASANQDRTGGPLSVGMCSNCHSSGSFNTNLSVELLDGSNNPVTSYIPGTTYTMQVTLSSSGAPAYGMQSVALDGANNGAGTFGTINTSNSQVSTVNGVNYFEHQGMSTSGVFSVDWTAPASGTGDVSIYAMGVAINANSGTSGDDPSSAVSFTFTEDVPTTIDFPGNPYCSDVSNPTPVVTGEQGGTFSAPSGLDINSSSGQINMAGSTPGTYTVSYAGATQSATFDVTINEAYAVSDAVTICANETYQFGSQTLSASDAGLNTEVFTAMSGCDSTVALTLTVTPDINIQILDTICTSETIQFEGQTLDASNAGLNEVTLTSAVTGCDSTRQLFLFVAPEATTSLSETICPSGTYDFNGQILDASDAGLNTLTLTGSNGCDSVVELTLNVTTIDLTIMLDGAGSFVANQANATYQWVDCDNNNAPIAGATNQSYTPLVNGNYAVEITVGSCTELSECEEILTFGLDENTQSLIDVYPIPANAVLFVQNMQDLTDVRRMEIVSLSGQTLWQQRNATHEINVSELPSGTYFLKVQHAQGTEVVKFVKR